MKRDDQGSLIIALAVILVLSGLSLAVLARTISALTSARVAQDGAAATKAADTGATDAIVVLNSGGPMSGAGPDYFWTAKVISGNEVSITSTGTVNRTSHVVTETATRGPAWPWLIATSSSFLLDGAATVAPSAPLASSGALALRNQPSGPSIASEIDLLGTGASCSASGNVCTDQAFGGLMNVSASNVALPAPPHPSDPPRPGYPAYPGSPNCPGTGPGDGTITTLTGGTYWCTGDVTFSGNVAVSGQVSIYITDGADDLSAPVKVHFDSATVSGTAANLALYVADPASILPGEGAQAGTFSGVVDAPYATLRSSACAFTLTGAMVLGSFDCVSAAGGPTLTYDSGVAALPSTTWRVTSYQDGA